MRPDGLYVPDRRGNRLAAYLFTDAPGVRMHHLELRCNDDIAAQFLDLDDCGFHYRRVDLANDEWTHRLEADGPPDPRVRSLADLLQDVITLPPPLPMSVALALDWYKIPAEDTEPDEWPYRRRRVWCAGVSIGRRNRAQSRPRGGGLCDDSTKWLPDIPRWRLLTLSS